MAVQTRARAAKADKPPSPLKNILKAPARRAAKAKTTSTATTSEAKVTKTKKAPAKVTKAAPKVARAAGAADDKSKRSGLTGLQRGRKKKIEEEVEDTAVGMDVDQIMMDAPAAVSVVDFAEQPSVVEISTAMASSRHQSPVKPSKLPRPSPRPSLAAMTQPTPSTKENTPLRHRISSTRLAKTTVVKKPSKEGLLSRSPLKSSLSLQSLLSPRKPKNTAQLSANDTKLFTFSRPLLATVDVPFMDDDVFQDKPVEPIFRYSSILSPDKASFASPRKSPVKEKFLSASPSRKNRSPEKQRSPLRTPPQSPPTSPERTMGSMMPFSSLFPGIPSSPASSPDHPAMCVASSPRKPLSEMDSPCIPIRSSSKSPKKHAGDTLTSRSPSKVPRLSPSKSSLRGGASAPPAQSLHLSTLHKPPMSPSKSSMRSPAKCKSTPCLSPKKSVTWNEKPSMSATPPLPSYVNVSALKGCVFYVDVRTAEGSDAGHLFIGLLQELGANVVSQWTSNSMNVTHVLFKDGDDRTLEKVVASNGTVKCVNVGWAVDCERFNKRLPESDYAIDLSRIPGMTPTTTPQPSRSRSLSPLPQTVSATPLPKTPLPSTSLNINNATLSITTPAFLASSKTVGAKSASNMSFQPSLSGIDAEEDKENLVPDDRTASPNTPYFLHPQDLVQKSCPPRPSLRGGAGPPDERGRELNRRLMLAKRKSMEWAPRVSSPLRLSSGGEEF